MSRRPVILSSVAAAAVLLAVKIGTAEAQPATGTSFQVTRYSIELNSRAWDSYKQFYYDALIRAKDDHANQLMIFVVSQGSAAPPAETTQDESGRWNGRMYVTPDRYAWYVDVLRNEKCTVTLNSQNPSFNSLGTYNATAGWGHVE